MLHSKFISDRKKMSLLFDQKTRIGFSLLLGGIIIKMFQVGNIGGGLLAFEGLSLYNADFLGSIADRFDALCNRFKLRPGFLMGIVLGAGSILSITVGIAEPSYAQFLGGTEQWLQTAIPGMDASLVSLIFNVLRAIFVIYVGISIVQVVQSARQGDDWQTLARTPLIIVVAVTLGDTLANLITGAGTSSTPTP